jgi:hypothetical protein
VFRTHEAAVRDYDDDDGTAHQTLSPLHSQWKHLAALLLTHIVFAGYAEAAAEASVWQCR